MEVKKSKIHKRDIFYMMLFIPFFEPSYIGHNISPLHMLFRLAAYASIFIIGIIYLSSVINHIRKISRPVIFIVIYSCILLFSTILNGGLVSTVIIEGVTLISLFMLSDIILQRSVKEYISVLYPIFYVLVVVNFITMLLYPDGMYKYVMDGSYYWASNNNWFLGYENALIVFLLPTLVYAYISNMIKGTRLTQFNCILITIICIYTPIVRWKASTIVCFFFFFLMCILSILKLAPNIFNAWTYLIFNVVMFLILVIIGVQGGILAFVVENVLRKGDTLGVRTVIWGKAIELISQKPVLGYGYEATRVITDKLKYDSTHNQYLWILYRGGMAQFGAFAWIIYSISNRLYKKREHLVVKVVAITFCVIMVMWQTEAITAYAVMTFLVFAYYVPEDQDFLQRLRTYRFMRKRA